jgi:hypothetical protein
VGESNWKGELESYLRDRLAVSCATFRQPVPFSGLRINPALGREESRYFLLGLEAGLFEVDDHGRIQSELLLTEDATGTAHLLFRQHPPPPRFFRETVCRLSTASALILKRGWLRSHVVIESIIEDDRSPVARADIMIRSATGQLLVSVKLKRNVLELEKLGKDLLACSNRGPHANEECGFPQNHPIYELCSRSRPAYFLGVAPDAEVCFQVKYDGDSVEVRPLPSLPPRSVIELNIGS